MDKQLGLTPEQLQQVAAAEAEVQAKLDKILTSQQQEQLRQIRPSQPMPAEQ
jgi:DNA-binding TFAR19-related protein (PDSD5 family)